MWEIEDMDSFKESMSEYRRQLEKGTQIERGTLRFIEDVENLLSKNG